MLMFVLFFHVGKFGHLDGVGFDSLLMYPTGISHDGGGDLFINEWYVIPKEEEEESPESSSGNKNAMDGYELQYLHNVRKIVLDTASITTIAGGLIRKFKNIYIYIYITLPP